MFQRLLCRGILTVIGAFLITMGVGLMYLWGIISIYATSYFRIHDPQHQDITQESTNIVFPLILLGQAISMPLTARFFKKSNPRAVCMVAGGILSIILYMSSYTAEFSTFALIFGLGSGIIIGIIYIYPIAHCHIYFPKKKSTVSGIIISASGIGTFIFALIASNMINPQNSHLPESKFYGNQIASAFPEYLRTLSLVNLVLIGLGGLLLFDYPSDQRPQQETNLAEALINQQFAMETDETEQKQKNPFGSMMYEMTYMNKGYDDKLYNKYKTHKNNERQFWPSISVRDRESSVHEAEPIQQTRISTQQDINQGLNSLNECPRVRDGPKETIFWHILLCIMLSVNINLLVSCNYKTYFKTKTDDYYLNMLGAFGAFCCGVSRMLLSGLASQRLSFQRVLWLLLVANCFISFTIPYFSYSRFLYSLYVIGCFVCYGGFLGIFPIISTRIFGRRYATQIYGLLFYGFPLSNFIQIGMIYFIEMEFGYWFVFMGSGGMCVLGLLMSNSITSTATEGYDWSQRIRENNERRRLLVH